MRILVGVAHPKQVYIFKNFIKKMEKRGHIIKVLAIQKEITEYLLQQANLPYTIIGYNLPCIYKNILSVPKWEYLTFKIAREFEPDIYIGRALPHFAHISTIFGKPYIILEDTEHAHVVQSISFPFADWIITPSCYREDLGKKQIRFDGYFELAYLHPNCFTPDPAVLTELGLTEADTFTVLRFVSWGASHDVGHSGLTLDTKRRAIQEFEKYGRVFITSEKSLPQEFEKYRIAVAPEKMHDLLYYATLLYGESATMASECAVLGTHAIFCDFAGRGYTDEEEIKYDLVYNYNLNNESQIESVNKGVQLLQEQDLKVKGRKKRERLLADNIDVTSYMIWFVENYPDSVSTAKENPEILKRFK